MIQANERTTNLIMEIDNYINSLNIGSLDLCLSPALAKPIEINHPMDLAPLIEHTSLRSDTTKEKIIRLCAEAKRFHFYGVCVSPIFVEYASQELEGTGIAVVSVVGFPLGASTTEIKVKEAMQLVKAGADEIDMVIMLGALKGRAYRLVYDDIRAVVNAIRPTPVKVIIEAGILDEREKIFACLLALRAGASFLKTSTGFAYAKTSKCYELKGATIDDIKIMRLIGGYKIGIKASGGIGNYETAKILIEAGASRIGSSASVSIIKV